MPVIVAVLIEPKQAEAAQTTQYTVPPGYAVLIDKFTVTNTTGTARNFSINLVTSGSVAAASNCVLSVRAIAPGESYTCPEIVGHVLEAGDFISTLASAASALTVRASGRVLS